LVVGARAIASQCEAVLLLPWMLWLHCVRCCCCCCCLLVWQGDALDAADVRGNKNEER
jgi:hypothetical protein